MTLFDECCKKECSELEQDKKGGKVLIEEKNTKATLSVLGGLSAIFRIGFGNEKWQEGGFSKGPKKKTRIQMCFFFWTEVLPCRSFSIVSPPPPKWPT